VIAGAIHSDMYASMSETSGSKITRSSSSTSRVRTTRVCSGRLRCAAIVGSRNSRRPAITKPRVPVSASIT
jgi:hypothetical protein